MSDIVLLENDMVFLRPPGDGLRAIAMSVSFTGSGGYPK